MICVPVTLPPRVSCELCCDLVNGEDNENQLKKRVLTNFNNNCAQIVKQGGGNRCRFRADRNSECFAKSVELSE